MASLTTTCRSATSIGSTPRLRRRRRRMSPPGWYRKRVTRKPSSKLEQRTSPEWLASSTPRLALTEACQERPRESRSRRAAAGGRARPRGRAAGHYHRCPPDQRPRRLSRRAPGGVGCLADRAAPCGDAARLGQPGGASASRYPGEPLAAHPGRGRAGVTAALDVAAASVAVSQLIVLRAARASSPAGRPG